MANRFTQKQVLALALAAGFTAADAKVMACIAMCEAPFSLNGVQYSDFDMIGDQALANATWGFSYSGWQVRSMRSAKGTGSYRDELRLPEPTFAAKAALQVFRNQGFRAWTTWNTGQWKAYAQDEYPPAPGTYIVIAGDSLTKIVRKLGLTSVTWQDLARVNGLHSPYTIFIGQVLLLPWFTYTVAKGDTLSSIAATYGQGVTYQQIADFNSITDPSKIAVGQVLLIPRATL